MKRLFINCCIILVGISCFTACHYKRAKKQADLWFPLELQTNTPIRNIHTSLTEMKVITDNEFIRLNINGDVTEYRELNLPFGFYGRPSIGEYTFIRLVRAQVAYPRPNLPDSIVQKPLMEVHLVKQAAQQIYRKDIDDISSDNLTFEDFARYSGAYNADESKFLLVTLNNTTAGHSLFLMNLGLNAQRTQISDITVDKRIDIDLPADTRLVSNTKFLNGNFYFCTEFGAWRIDPVQGTATKLFSSWIKDAFEKDGKIYLTGFNDFDFYVSTDNGITFGPVGGGSSLKFVETVNGEVFTQDQLGLPWRMATNDLLSANPLIVNEDFEDSGAEFWNIKYFYNRYYISIQKQLYYAEDLEVED